MACKKSAKKNISASAENHSPFRLVSNSYIRYHGFSHGGMRTTTGTPIIAYWYVALIKNQNTKRAKN